MKEKANNLVRNVGKTSEQVLNYGKDMFYNVRENFSGNIKNNVDSFLNRGQGLNNQTKKSEPLEEKSPVSQVIVANEERTHGEWTNIDSKKDKFQYNLTQGKYANAGDEEKNGMMNGTSCEKYTVNVDSYEEIGDDGVIYVKSPKNGEKETIEVPVFNTFDKYGCKMTSAAVIVGLATGKNIDILDINDCDENRDGLFTMSECKAAFEKYLGNESEVSCKRYENVEGSSNTFSKETFDNIVESEDEVYVIARATSGHWIVLTGYNLDKDTNKLEFEYKGSSTNDIRYNRKSHLSN